MSHPTEVRYLDRLRTKLIYTETDPHFRPIVGERVVLDKTYEVAEVIHVPRYHIVEILLKEAA